MPETALIDPGYDARDLRPLDDWHELDSLVSLPDQQLIVVWEPPQPRHTYFIGADVSDGIGQDRSVADVVRLATLERPFEQVAQYVSGSVDPVDFAHVLDTLGRFYHDSDGFEAKMAVETNNQGIATQSELERHLGYTNFYVWQWEDSVPGSNRFTRKVGWYTSRRTRPILLTRYHKAVSTFDPVTGEPDLVINSQFTIDEMRDFQTEGQLWEAEAGPGSNDDCIMAGAIAYFTAQQEFHEGGETIAEQRRRRAWNEQRRKILTERRGQAKDFINTDATAEEMLGYQELGEGYDPSWP